MPLQTTKQYYRVDRRHIGFMKFIFEAYDGLVQIRTLDPKTGCIELNIAPGCEDVVETILQDLTASLIIIRTHY